MKSRKKNIKREENGRVRRSSEGETIKNEKKEKKKENGGEKEKRRDDVKKVQ